MEEREMLPDGTPKEPKHYNMECEAGKFEGVMQGQKYPAMGTKGLKPEAAWPFPTKKE